MIIGIGVDLCQIDRFEQMAQRRPGAVAKVLTPAETAVRNAAVVAAARALRAAGAGEAREIALLARAHRAEIYLPRIP